MSAKATGYGFESNFGDKVRKLIFLAMADSANTKTGVMWHSVSSIAEMAETSERTVQRHLPELLRLGYIREGDQSHVEHIPVRYRPTVYQVATSDTERDAWAGADAPIREAASAAGATRNPGVSERHPYEVTQSHPSTDVRGDKTGTSGVTNSRFRGDTAVSPKQEENQELTGTPPTALRPGHPSKPTNADADARFEEFWDAYAKKVDRADAVKAWRRAIRNGNNPDELIAAAKTYRDTERRLGTDDRHIKYPATWLNKESWNNERPPATPAPAVPLRPSAVTEQAPDGLTDAEYAAWEHAQLRARRTS